MNKNREDEDEGGEGKGGYGFFACYLLTSLSPRHKGHTYIGFTVNPKRRIRQHNGEIGSGAVRTKKKRPWEMVMCIYGFPTNVSALQFEWAWQHPRESLAVTKAAANFKSLSGLGNKIKLALTMITLPKWQNLDLTVNFFSSKYTKHLAGSQIPESKNIRFCSMEDLPCYTGIYNDPEDEDNDLIDETSTNDAYTKEGDPYNYNNNKLIRADTTLDLSKKADKGISNSRIDDDFNGFFDFGVYNDDPESEDLYNSNKDRGVIDLGKEADSSIVYNEVEIIDLLSPSPGYNRVGLESKRRRVSTSRDVIDLTTSPIFV